MSIGDGERESAAKPSREIRMRRPTSPLARNRSTCPESKSAWRTLVRAFPARNVASPAALRFCRPHGRTATGGAGRGRRHAPCLCPRRSDADSKRGTRTRQVPCREAGQWHLCWGRMSWLPSRPACGRLLSAYTRAQDGQRHAASRLEIAVPLFLTPILIPPGGPGRRTAPRRRRGPPAVSPPRSRPRRWRP